jgi:hypothetical protein
MQAAHNLLRRGLRGLIVDAFPNAPLNDTAEHYARSNVRASCPAGLCMGWDWAHLHRLHQHMRLSSLRHMALTCWPRPPGVLDPAWSHRPHVVSCLIALDGRGCMLWTLMLCQLPLPDCRLTWQLCLALCPAMPRSRG